MKTFFSILGNLIKYMALILILVILLGLIALYPTLSRDYDMANHDVSLSTKDTFYPDMSSKILDKNGNVITIVTKEHKRFTYMDDVPKWTKEAFISIEDRTFYENKGYDLKGQARVLLRFALTKGSERHGASTITQQLVKMVFLSPEQTISRKVKELFYAREMTRHYTKDEILTFYVNNCCFANNIYGIEEAAKEYLGKDAKDLTLGETAYLCAIPNRPSYYDPWKSPDHIRERQKKILSDMESCGYITAKEKEKALSEEIHVQSKQEYSDKEDASSLGSQKTYAIQCAVEELMREDGFTFQTVTSNDNDYAAYQASYKAAYQKAKEKLYTHRYTIQTALDPGIVSTAQEKLDTACQKYGDKAGESGAYLFQSALAVFDNTTGKVVATIGGRSQDHMGSSLNRAFQSHRQPGSTMKPLFVYAPAIEKGYSGSSILTNVSVKEAKHSHDVKSMGGSKVDLRTALWKSMNGPAYWLSATIGPKTGMETLSKMRFDSLVPEDNSLSTALGGMTYGTNPVEMASAYGVFTNQGYYRSPTCVTGVLDMNGTNIYTEPEEERVFSQDTADTMADLMKGVLTDGTGKKVGPVDGMDSAGKTGTTNQTKDVWFTGFTPYYTISVWMGQDDGAPLEGKIASTVPAVLWKDVMTALVQGKAPAQFEAAGQKLPKVSLTLPYANDPLPYYYPNEEIQNEYLVSDYRNDLTKSASLEKQAKAFHGTDEEKISLLSSLTKDLYGIKNTTIRKETYENIVQSLSLSNDLSMNEAETLQRNLYEETNEGTE
jgi:penicillin-binding protein 1A